MIVLVQNEVQIDEKPDSSEHGCSLQHLVNSTIMMIEFEYQFIIDIISCPSKDIPTQ